MEHFRDRSVQRADVKPDHSHSSADVKENAFRKIHGRSRAIPKSYAAMKAEGKVDCTYEFPVVGELPRHETCPEMENVSGVAGKTVAKDSGNLKLKEIQVGCVSGDNCVKNDFAIGSVDTAADPGFDFCGKKESNADAAILTDTSGGCSRSEEGDISTDRIPVDCAVAYFDAIDVLDLSMSVGVSEDEIAATIVLSSLRELRELVELLPRNGNESFSQRAECDSSSFNVHHGDLSSSSSVDFAAPGQSLNTPGVERSRARGDILATVTDGMRKKRSKTVHLRPATPSLKTVMDDGPSSAIKLTPPRQLSISSESERSHVRGTILATVTDGMPEGWAKIVRQRTAGLAGVGVYVTIQTPDGLMLKGPSCVKRYAERRGLNPSDLSWISFSGVPYRLLAVDGAVSPGRSGGEPSLEPQTVSELAEGGESREKTVAAVRVTENLNGGEPTAPKSKRKRGRPPKRKPGGERSKSDATPPCRRLRDSEDRGSVVRATTKPGCREPVAVDTDGLPEGWYRRVHACGPGGTRLYVSVHPPDGGFLKGPVCVARYAEKHGLDPSALPEISFSVTRYLHLVPNGVSQPSAKSWAASHAKKQLSKAIRVASNAGKKRLASVSVDGSRRENGDVKDVSCAEPLGGEGVREPPAGTENSSPSGSWNLNMYDRLKSPRKERKPLNLAEEPETAEIRAASKRPKFVFVEKENRRFPKGKKKLKRSRDEAGSVSPSKTASGRPGNSVRNGRERLKSQRVSVRDLLKSEKRGVWKRKAAPVKLGIRTKNDGKERAVQASRAPKKEIPKLDSEVYRTADGLPQGWLKVVRVLKSEPYAGTHNVAYYSPEGYSIRCKKQLENYVRTMGYKGVDLNSFDFSASKKGGQKRKQKTTKRSSSDTTSFPGKKAAAVSKKAKRKKTCDGSSSLKTCGPNKKPKLEEAATSISRTASGTDEDVKPDDEAVESSLSLLYSSKPETVAGNADPRETPASDPATSLPSDEAAVSTPSAEQVGVARRYVGDTWRLLVASCFLDVGLSSEVLETFFKTFPTAAELDDCGWMDAADFLADSGCPDEEFAKRLARLTYEFCENGDPAQLTGVNEFVRLCFAAATTCAPLV